MSDSGLTLEETEEETKLESYKIKYNEAFS